MQNIIIKPSNLGRRKEGFYQVPEAGLEPARLIQPSAFSKILPMLINKNFEVKRCVITAKEFEPVNGFSNVYGYKELEANGIVN